MTGHFSANTLSNKALSNEAPYNKARSKPAACDLPTHRRAPRQAAFWICLAVAFTAFVQPASSQSAARKLPAEIVPQAGHGGGEVWSVAISRDGRLILSGGADHTVRLWDVQRKLEIRTFAGHTQNVASVVIMPDGKTALSGSWDGTIRHWDLETGAALRTFTGHQDSVQSLALSSDGRTLLSASLDKTVRIWDVPSGNEIRVVKGHQGGVTVVAFMPGEQRIVSGGSDNLIKIWDTATGRELKTLRGHAHFINAIAVSPDSRQLVAASEDDEARLWDIETGRTIRSFKNNVDMKSAMFCPDGKRAVLSGNGDVTLVDTETGKVLRKFRDSGSKTLAATSDGSGFVLGDGLSLWNIETGKETASFMSNGVNGSGLALSANGAQLLIGTDNNNAKLWDLRNGAELRSFQTTSDATSPEEVKTVRLSKDGKMALAVGDAAAKLWDTETGREIRSLAKKDTSFRSADIIGDGKQIVTADGSGLKPIVRLWDSTTGRETRAIGGYQQDIESVAASADGHMVATGSRDKSVKLIDASSGKLIRTIPGAGDYISSVALSPDGKSAVAGDMAGKILLIDISGARPARVIQAYDYKNNLLAFVTSVAFSPDSRRVATTSPNGIVKVFDAGSGAEIRALASPQGEVRSVAFSPDGRHVVASGIGTTFRVWEIESGAVVANAIFFKDGEWIVLTPEGFFNASANAAKNLIVVRGFDIFSVDQFYQSLFRPDLVREKLAGDPRGLVREAAVRLDLTRVVGSGNAPAARIVSPADGSGVTNQIQAVAELTSRGGGIGRVEWRVNGVTVGVDTPPAPAAGQPARLTRNLSLDAGSNAIEVVAYNGANLVASVPVRVSVTAPAAPPAPGQPVAAQPSRLFVIAAGIDDYADSRFKLTGSVRDAQALSKAIAATGSGLYKSVEVKLLTDTAVSKDKLEAAFKDFAAQASPSDVFLLYLAGHGKTVDGRYYFIPRDFKVGDNSDEKIVNAAVVKQGIAQEQWQRWFASIPARKSMILFDTCESGTLTGDIALTKTLEQSAANDRLAQATGRSIITASSGTQVAFEGYRGHGLFTYNLLDALDRADSDGNGTIEINELAAYVYAQVTTLSEQVFRQRQEPQIRIASSYPLTKRGRVLAGELPAVAENNAPPVLLAQTADLQIKPGPGATVVRSLNAKTPVTVLKSEGGWSLVASGGRPVGYVATRDLTPARATSGK